MKRKTKSKFVTDSVQVITILHNRDRANDKGDIQPGIYLVDPMASEIAESVHQSERDGYPIVWVRWSNVIDLNEVREARKVG